MAKLKKKLDNRLLRYSPKIISRLMKWRRSCRGFESQLQLPRTYISKTMIPTLEECNTVIRNEVKSGNMFFLTIDCWTSANMKSYITLTAHYINNDFKLISILLECSIMEGNILMKIWQLRFITLDMVSNISPMPYYTEFISFHIDIYYIF